MRPVTLESARVRLDVPTRADAAAITDACQDPEIVRWTTVPTPYREQDARTFVDALVGPGWASDREYTWAIRRSGSNWLEGVISYRTAGRDLGFWLAPSARGTGLMRDAVDLVVGWAFEAGAPDVYWECYEGNTASARVARATGFSYTGLGEARIPARDGAPTTAWTALRRADGSPASAIPWPIA
ncbi:GNAT family N-acetyltransferase [Curtobacterium sp. VKM Ac-1376]|uniref:GNAT family N-acetyltransferase n=1 Tax=Curtobacterium sp. VKM Ac-1376 TaxID=123312 RepID=UPI00188A6255|nr:GNAT family N-acetyltransferase [Curtobacterium sp. VKM Ac-1376]MBF4613795.1 GNAT family N-acetyltransferase [Curtobacterium sp. VKM Ac-1376]